MLKHGAELILLSLKAANTKPETGTNLQAPVLLAMAAKRGRMMLHHHSSSLHAAVCSSFSAKSCVVALTGCS